jgi:hypothetical protein
LNAQTRYDSSLGLLARKFSELIQVSPLFYDLRWDSLKMSFLTHTSHYYTGFY